MLKLANVKGVFMAPSGNITKWQVKKMAFHCWGKKA